MIGTYAGDHLRQLRRSQKMNTKTLSKMINISRYTIENIEKDYIKMTEKTYNKIRMVFPDFKIEGY